MPTEQRGGVIGAVDVGIQDQIKARVFVKANRVELRGNLRSKIERYAEVDLRIRTEVKSAVAKAIIGRSAQLGLGGVVPKAEAHALARDIAIHCSRLRIILPGRKSQVARNRDGANTESGRGEHADFVASGQGRAVERGAANENRIVLAGVAGKAKVAGGRLSGGEDREHQTDGGGTQRGRPGLVQPTSM